MASPSGLEASLIDPLNDPDELGSILPLSSAVKRVTRSHQSTRLLSLSARNKPTATFSSPRKQTFHLDVGNKISPQKIRVTVETDDQENEEIAGNEASNGWSDKRGRNDGVRRRLFTNAPSSTPKSAPRHRQVAPALKPLSPTKSANFYETKTTTSTSTTRVPLRDLSEDENDHLFINHNLTPYFQFQRQERTMSSSTSTPKPRRGRPRRAATPVPPSTARTKRSVSPDATAPTAATPAKRTRRTRTASPKLEEEPAFDMATTSASVSASDNAASSDDAAASAMRSPVKKSAKATPKKSSAASAKKSSTAKARATPKTAATSNSTARASAKKDSTSTVQSTPRRNPRRASTRSAASANSDAESASESASESATESRSRRRGRPRRQPVTPGEMAVIDEQNEPIEQIPLPPVPAQSVSPARTAETDLNTHSRMPTEEPAEPAIEPLSELATEPAEERAPPASPTTTSLSSVDLIRTQTPVVESEDELASANPIEGISRISMPPVSTPRASAQMPQMSPQQILTPHFSSPVMSTPRVSSRNSRISTLRHTISPGEDELSLNQPTSTHIQDDSIEPVTYITGDDQVPTVLASLNSEDAIAHAITVYDEELLPALATEPAVTHEELATVNDHGEVATKNNPTSPSHNDDIEEHAFVEYEEQLRASTEDESINAESAATATSIDEPVTRLASESIEEVEAAATNNSADHNNGSRSSVIDNGSNAANSNNHTEGVALYTNIDTDIVVEDPVDTNNSSKSHAGYDSSPSPVSQVSSHPAPVPVLSVPVHGSFLPSASHPDTLYDPSSPPPPSHQPASDSAAAYEPSSPPSLMEPPQSFTVPSESFSSDSDGEVDIVPTDAVTEAEEHSDIEPHDSDAAPSNLRDQDTIAQGEDFSMIGMESLQSSMHMSHSELPEMGEITSRIVSRTLESLRHGNQDDNDDERGMSTLDFIIQPSDSTAPSPAPSPAPPSVSHFSAAASSSPVRISNRDFESSHLSQRSSPLRPVGSPKKKQEPLGKLIARKSLHEAQAAATPSTYHSSGATEDPEPSDHGSSYLLGQTTDAFEDSFSEIPESVLEAAIPETTNTVYFSQQQADLTGRVPLHASLTAQSEPGLNDFEIEEGDDDYAARGEPVSDDPILFSTGAAAVASAAIKEVRTMPHIEATSRHSDYEVSDNGNSEGNDDGDDNQAVQTFSAQSGLEITSSPPLHAAQQVDRVARPPPNATAQSRSSKTPTSLLSSPRPPPPAAGHQVGSSDQADRLSLASDGLRPSLSPIVRAGRALQGVTSDPPSPKDGEPFLRSPFRRSVTREVQSPAETPQPSAASATGATQFDAQPTEAMTPAPIEVTTPAQAPPSSSRPLWSMAVAPFSGLKSLVVQGAQIISPRFLSSTSASPAQQTQNTPAHLSRRRTAEDAQLDGLSSSSHRGISRTKRQKLSPSATHSTPVRSPRRRRTGSSSGSNRSWRTRFFRENSVAGSITGFASKLVSRSPNSETPGQIQATASAHSVRETESPADPMVVNGNNVEMANVPSSDGHDMDVDANVDDVDIWAIEAARTPRPAPVPPRIAEVPVRISDIPQHPIRRRGNRSLRTGLIGNDENGNAFSLLQTESDTKNSSLPDSPPEQRQTEFNLDDFFSSPVAVPRMLPPTSEQNIKFNEKSRQETLERLLEHERERDNRIAEEEEREFQEEYDREVRKFKARRARQIERARRRRSAENHSVANATDSTPSQNTLIPVTSTSTDAPSASDATHLTQSQVEDNRAENDYRSYGFTAPSDSSDDEDDAVDGPSDDSPAVLSPRTANVPKGKVLVKNSRLAAKLRPHAQTSETRSPADSELTRRPVHATAVVPDSREGTRGTETAHPPSHSGTSPSAEPSTDVNDSSLFDAMWETMPPRSQEQTWPLFDLQQPETSTARSEQAQRASQPSAFDALWDSLLPENQREAPRGGHPEPESEAETNLGPRQGPELEEELEPEHRPQRRLGFLFQHQPEHQDERRSQRSPGLLRQVTPERQPSQPPEHQPQPRLELLSEDRQLGRGQQPGQIAPRSQFAVIPQKQNFVPFVRTARNVFFEDTSELAPAEEPAFTQEEASDQEDEPSFLTPVLKPLPDKSASPTKSCLRPATKPKLPGRVVEFTSSTMSANTDASEILAGRAASDEAALRFAEHFALDTENRVARSPLRPEAYNEDGDVLMTDVRDISMELTSSGTGRGYEVDQELSDIMLSDTHQISIPSPLMPEEPRGSHGQPIFHQTDIVVDSWEAPPAIRLPPPRDWTLEDWLVMDEVAKEIRGKGPLRSMRERLERRRRTSGELHHKVVHAKTVAMVVSDWHLDIVDVFHLRAGRIWNEHYVLRRLFSLFIAEARRGVFEASPE